MVSSEVALICFYSLAFALQATALPPHVRRSLALTQLTLAHAFDDEHWSGPPHAMPLDPPTDDEEPQDDEMLDEDDEVGKEGDDTFDRTTGEGYVAPVNGDYADAVRNPPPSNVLYEIRDEDMDTLLDNAAARSQQGPGRHVPSLTTLVLRGTIHAPRCHRSRWPSRRAASHNMV